jgi:hypothetical protein
MGKVTDDLTDPRLSLCMTEQQGASLQIQIIELEKIGCSIIVAPNPSR